VRFVKTFLSSILADGVVIQGVFFLRGGSHCRGGLRFSGAQIEGQFNCSHSFLEREGSRVVMIVSQRSFSMGPL
jgi:hypothetical protein